MAAAPAFVMPLDEAGKPYFGPKIEGPLDAWRSDHPDALVANVSRRKDLTDADFAHLAGIKALDMTMCCWSTA